MNGYRNLASSPPLAGDGPPAPVPPGAAEDGKWEGVAVGAATIVRNLSSASQRFGPAVERSKSTTGHRRGLQAAVRRAFSMRRQPSSSFADGYWRIHDDIDDGAAAEQQQEKVLEEEEEDQEQKKGAEQADAAGASSKEINKGRKKKGHIFKACKKLLGF